MNNTKYIKLRVIEGAPGLKGKILELIKVDEMRYLCKKNNIELIDTWEEIYSIQDIIKKQKVNTFFNLHLFSSSFGDELKYITEIKILI